MSHLEKKLFRIKHHNSEHVPVSGALLGSMRRLKRYLLKHEDYEK